MRCFLRCFSLFLCYSKVIMKTYRRFIFTLILLACMAGLSAQSADMVTRMLETDEITFGQAGYFMAVYLELVPDEANGRASLDALETAGLGSYRNTDKVLKLSELAGMCMKVWKIPGGFMYSLLKTNHYAFRELQAKGYISFAEDPMDRVSGKRALNLIYKLMEAEGADNDE